MERLSVVDLRSLWFDFASNPFFEVSILNVQGLGEHDARYSWRYHSLVLQYKGPRMARRLKDGHRR